MAFFRNIQTVSIAVLLSGSMAFLFYTQEIKSESPQEALSSLIGAMNSYESLRANITINNSMTGTLSFKRPNSLHVKFSDGRVISSNGKFMWFYSPSRAIVGKQDLKGSTGGIGGLLGGYSDVQMTGRSLRLKSDQKYYEEIIVVLGTNNTPKAIRMKTKNDPNYLDVSFSGVQTNIGLSASLFNFAAPSNAQIVENPLNQKE